MKSLTFAIGALAGASLFAAAPAEAQQPFGINSFSNYSTVFTSADLDRNGSLSGHEYVLMRGGMIDQAWVGDYRYSRLAPGVVQSFSRLDRNDNGALSRAEFTTLGNAAVRAQTGWDWRPDYVTLTYYLMANPIPTASFTGQPVMNSAGQQLGIIRQITRHEGTGDYYALVTMSERVMDSTPTPLRAEAVGVPLEDLLLVADGKSVMLSQRGQRFFLRHGEAELDQVDIDQLDPVGTLHQI